MLLRVSSMCVRVRARACHVRGVLACTYNTYTCAYIYMRTYVYAYVHTSKHKYTYTSAGARVYIYIYACKYTFCIYYTIFVHFFFSKSIVPLINYFVQNQT